MSLLARLERIGPINSDVLSALIYDDCNSEHITKVDQVERKLMKTTAHEDLGPDCLPNWIVFCVCKLYTYCLATVCY